MSYDYRKAAELAPKAERLLHQHRSRVFGAKPEAHTRAILRIKSLMAPHWRERSSHLAGERLTRMGY